MADLLLLIPLVLCLWGLKPCRGIHEDPLNRSTTHALRGILALGILFVHIAQYCPGWIFFSVIEKLGPSLVAPFFFLSGYSLLKQHMTQPNYAKGFLRKRFLGILLPYLVITLLYWSYYQLLGKHYQLLHILELLSRGMLLVSFSWFIPALLSFYLAFWGLMKLCKKSYSTLVLGGGVWFALYTLICLVLKFEKWWYLSAFSTVIGMAWALREQTILKALQKRYWLWLIAAAVALAGIYVLRYLVASTALIILLQCCSTTIFTIFVVLLLYKLQPGNPALGLLGSLSMEIYLMQGLAIKILRGPWIYVENPLLYGLLVILLTLAFAAVVHIAFKGIPKKPTR